MSRSVRFGVCLNEVLRYHRVSCSCTNVSRSLCPLRSYSPAIFSVAICSGKTHITTDRTQDERIVVPRTCLPHSPNMSVYWSINVQACLVERFGSFHALLWGRGVLYDTAKIYNWQPLRYLHWLCRGIFSVTFFHLCIFRWQRLLLFWW